VEEVLNIAKMKPDYIAIAIAGPVKNDTVGKFMNISWPGFSA
jgi:glucokinase